MHRARGGPPGRGHVGPCGVGPPAIPGGIREQLEDVLGRAAGPPLQLRPAEELGQVRRFVYEG